MSKTVDARGLACPKPVIMTKTALDTDERIVVIVDNPAARENVCRLAKSKGCALKVEEKPDGIYISIISGSPKDKGVESTVGLADPVEDADRKTGPVVITVQQDRMGRGNDELGYVLIKSFLHTLGEVRPAPDVMIFLNTGVRLCVKGSDVIEDLKHLQEKKVKMLVCGTCLDFFGLMNELEAGMISNMYNISEILLSAGKIVTL